MCSGKGISSSVKLPSSPWNLGQNKDWAMSADRPSTRWTDAASMFWRRHHMWSTTYGKVHRRQDAAFGLKWGNCDWGSIRKRSSGWVQVSCKQGQFCTRAASLGRVLAQLQLGEEPCTLLAECQEPTLDELVMEWRIITENGDRISLLGDTRASLSAVSRALFSVPNSVQWAQFIGPDVCRMELPSPAQGAVDSFQLSTGVLGPWGCNEREGITGQSLRTMSRDSVGWIDGVLQSESQDHPFNGPVVLFHQCESWRHVASSIEEGPCEDEPIMSKATHPSGSNDCFHKQEQPGSEQFAEYGSEDQESKAEDDGESRADDDLNEYSGIARDAQESLNMLSDSVSAAVHNVDKTSAELSDLESTFRSLLQSIKSMQNELGAREPHKQGVPQGVERCVDLQCKPTPDPPPKPLWKESTDPVSGSVHVYACDNPTSQNGLDSDTEDWTPRDSTIAGWDVDSLESSSSENEWEGLSQCSSSDSYPPSSEADPIEDVLDDGFLGSVGCSEVERNPVIVVDSLLDRGSPQGICSGPGHLDSHPSSEIKLVPGSAPCDVPANLETGATQEKYSPVRTKDLIGETNNELSSVLSPSLGHCSQSNIGIGADLGLYSTASACLNLRGSLSENWESCFEHVSDVESVAGEDPIPSLQSTSSDDSLTCLVEVTEGLVSLNPDAAKALALTRSAPVEGNSTEHVVSAVKDAEVIRNEEGAGAVILSAQSDLLPWHTSSAQGTEESGRLSEVEGNEWCQHSKTAGRGWDAGCTGLEWEQEFSPSAQVHEGELGVGSGISQRNNAWDCGLQRCAGPMQAHRGVLCAAVGEHFPEGPDHGIRCDEVDLRLANRGHNSFSMTDPEGCWEHAGVCHLQDERDDEDGIELMQPRQSNSNECNRIIVITDVELFLYGYLQHQSVRFFGRGDCIVTIQLDARAPLLKGATGQGCQPEGSWHLGAGIVSARCLEWNICNTVVHPSALRIEQTMQMGCAPDVLKSPTLAQESRAFPVQHLAARRLPNSYSVGVPRSLVLCPQFTTSETMNNCLHCDGTPNSICVCADGSHSLQSVDWSQSGADEEDSRLGAQHDGVLSGASPNFLAPWETGFGRCTGVGGARLGLKNNDGQSQRVYKGMLLNGSVQDCGPFVPRHMGDLHSRYNPAAAGSAVMWSLQMELEHQTRDAGGRLPCGMCVHSTGPGACRFCSPEWRWQQLKGDMSCSLDLNNTGFWKMCIRRTCHACKVFVHWWTMRVEKCCGYATSTWGNLFSGPSLKYGTKNCKAGYSIYDFD